MRHCVTFVLVLIVLFLTSATALAKALNDSFDILDRHFEAMGGLDKVKSFSTSHVEGQLVLVGTGLEGTFVNWSQDPILNRQEVDLKIITQTSGDNGEFAWMVDQNGKLQILQDEQTRKQRQLQTYLSEYEYLNPESEIFDVTFEGIDTASGKDCYLIRFTNSINNDVSTQCYDTSSFMLIKTIAVSPEGESTTWHSDYREVDGMPFAFKQVSVSYPSGMTQEMTFTTVEFNVPIDTKMFEPPSEDVEDFRFTSGFVAEDIPFQFIENHIYLPVELGGKTCLWILDSGASITVIDNNFARELGLPIEGKIKGQGTGNLIDVSFTELPPFSLPGLEFDKQTAAVIEISEIFDRWLNMEVVGILGYDFLSRLITKVDYANEMLSFYHPDSFSYAGDGVILETPISDGNTFEVSVMVDGKYGGLWSLDLGAGGMSYHYPYAAEHGLLDVPGIDALGHGAGGSQPRRRLLSKTMEMAGFTVEGLEVSVPTERGEGGFGYTEHAGNIGNTLLRHFVLYFDYNNQQMIVEPGDDFGTDFPRDNSGLQIANTPEDSLVVIHVSPGTPAEKAGFKLDDVIIAVNDIEAENLGGIIAFNRLLKKDPGTVLTVDVRRQGKVKTLKLELADLFNWAM